MASLEYLFLLSTPYQSSSFKLLQHPTFYSAKKTRIALDKVTKKIPFRKFLFFYFYKGLIYTCSESLHTVQYRKQEGKKPEKNVYN